jgi:hypothetical protein
MDDIIAKSSDRSRSLMFELLQSCLLDENALESCPLAQQCNTLSLEEKYNCAMSSSDEEVHKIREQPDDRFRKRITAKMHDS